MEDIVRSLETIIEDIEDAEAVRAKRRQASGHGRQPKSGPRVLTDKFKALASPWCSRGSRVANALETLVSRIEDANLRTNLEVLCKHVEADLGPQATDPLSGVYNPARLLRFLYQSEMDVDDARAQVVLTFNARKEFAVDAKREHIVSEDFSFGSLPRMKECRKYQPGNHFIGFGKDGRKISYEHLGRECDLDGLKKAFSVEEYVEGGFHHNYQGRVLYPAFVLQRSTYETLLFRQPRGCSNTLRTDTHVAR